MKMVPIRSPRAGKLNRTTAEGERSMPFNNIGPMELIIVLVIALIVIGPKRLPEVGKSLGRGMREFKDSISGSNRDDEDDELDAPLTRAK